MTSSPYCLDCIREGSTEPRVKSGGSSYCTHHVYKRTQAARGKSELRSIVTLLNSTSKSDREAAVRLLDKRDRHAQFRIGHALTFEFASHAENSATELRQLGLDYDKADPQLARIHQQIEEQLTIAFILRERRFPNDTEKLEIHGKAHPHYERDLEDVKKYKRTSGPDEDYVPSFARDVQ